MVNFGLDTGVEIMIKPLKEIVEKIARRKKGDPASNHAAAVVEVAESFNVSRSSVYRMLTEGESFVYWTKDSPYPRLLRTSAVCVVS